MKQPRLVPAFAVCIFLASSVNAQQSGDETVLRQLIGAHQAASERGDLHGLVDIYDVDADVISSTGKVTHGRDAIEADYRNLLASETTKSGRHHTHPADSIAIKFLTPDIALIDVASVNVGGRDGAGAPMPDSRSQLFTVWRKQNGRWLAVYQRAVPRPQ